MKDRVEQRARRIQNDGLLKRCRDTIRKVVPEAKVVLYGSRARGEAGKESDYDLLVLLDQAADWRIEDQIRQALYPLQLETGAVFTVLCYDKAEWNSPVYRAMPFVRNVEQDGIVL